jgi:hypothetical protein
LGELLVLVELSLPFLFAVAAATDNQRSADEEGKSCAMTM